MKGKTIDELSVGQEASFTKTVSESDVYLFAGITGDFNPAHVNEAYAKKTAFKTRIAHGMLSAGLISNVLGNQLPGPWYDLYAAATEFSGARGHRRHDNGYGRGDRDPSGKKAGPFKDRMHQSGRCRGPGR